MLWPSEFYYIGRALEKCLENDFRSACLRTIFMVSNTLQHAEFKSEELPHCGPAIFSQTLIIVFTNFTTFFYCSTTRLGGTRLHSSKRPIPVNQPHSFAWIILNYMIFCALDVNNISSTSLARYRYYFLKSSSLWPTSLC